MAYTYQPYQVPGPYRAAPPPQYEYYRSPYTGTLAQLVGSADRANAQAALASGNAQARIAQNVGEGVNNTLNTIIKASQYGQAHRDDAQQHEIRQMQIDAAKQKLADDATLTSVISGEGRTPTTAMSTPLDENGQPVQGSEWTSGEQVPGGNVPSRQEILSRLPAHLQSTATKMFEESDKLARDAQTSKAALAKAQRDAADSVNEHIAHLGYAVAKAKGDPMVTQFALGEARKTYADDPEVMKRIGEFEQQLGDFTDAKTNLQVGTFVANLSDKFRAALEKPEPNRTVRVKNADGSEVEMIVPDIAGTSFKSAAPQPKVGSEEYNLAAYATSIGKQGQPLTFAEINTANKLMAAAKHIESGEKLTAEQHKDLVDAVIKNPALFAQMTAKTKEAIVPTLNKLGFDKFAVGATPSMQATAERWRVTALAKLHADGMFQGADLKAEEAKIQESYLKQIGGLEPTPAGPAAPTFRNVLGNAPQGAPAPTATTPAAAPPATPPLPPSPGMFTGARPPAPPAAPEAAPAAALPSPAPPAPPAPPKPAPLPPPTPGKFQLQVGNQMLQFPNKAAAEAWAQKHGMSLK